VPDDFTIATAWRRDWVAVHVTGIVPQEAVDSIEAALGRAPGRRVQLDLTRAELVAGGFTETVARWQEEFGRTGRVLTLRRDEAPELSRPGSTR
jgi:hypothetical protein